MKSEICFFWPTWRQCSAHTYILKNPSWYNVIFITANHFISVVTAAIPSYVNKPVNAFYWKITPTLIDVKILFYGMNYHSVMSQKNSD